MRIWNLLFVVAAGCAATPPPPAATPVAPPPPPVAVDFEVHGSVAAEETVAKNQAPELKLKLGHYKTYRLGIGLVLDRTNDKKAKVRFDGTDQTVELIPQYFWHRTEYHRALTGAPNDKVIVVHHGGDVMLHMEGLGDDGAYLWRDGDADPL